MSSTEEHDELLGRTSSGQLDKRRHYEQPESKAAEWIKAHLAEFVATLLFVFVGVTSVINNTNHVTKSTDIVGVALAHGLMIFLMVSMTAHVSGGHVNPAVSMGVWLAGEINFVRFLTYSLSQIIGAIIGAALALGLNNNSDMYGIYYGYHNPSDVTAGQAFGIEIITTFVLVSTVLTAAVDPKGFKTIASLCIGMAVAAGILATGTITGGSMNPARSFGPAFVTLNAETKNSSTFPIQGSYYDSFWKNQWIYIFAPLLGGALASIHFRLVISSQSLKRISFF